MKTLIETEYLKLNSKEFSASGVCNILNNIIQIKLNEPSLRNFGQNISADLKQYLNALINQSESSSFGYDSIEVKKIKEILLEFTLSESLQYLDFFIRQLQKNSFEAEIRCFQKFKYWLILKHSFKKNNLYKPRYLLNICLYLPQYSFFSLLLTLFIIASFVAIVLMPAPIEFMGIFDFQIKYQSLSSNFVLNHLMNLFGYFVGLETEFEIVPLNVFSMGAIILSKIFSFLFIANYLFSKLGDFLKR